MPIRFRCVYCGQLLSIATRKAGSQVDCPKCSHPNNVPRREETEQEAASGSEPAKVAKAFESKKFDKWLGREEEKEPVEPSASDSGELKAVSDDFEPGVIPNSESASAVEEPWKRDVENLPDARTTEQSDPAIGTTTAVLLAVAAVALLLLAFGLGILVDRFALRGDSSASPTDDTAEKAEASNTNLNADPMPGLIGKHSGPPIPLTGTILHSSTPAGDVTPDSGALVIVLPASVSIAPDRKIRSEEIRRGNAAERLASYGGQITEVQSDGKFIVDLPEPGNYWVLVLSRNAPRDPSVKMFRSEQDTLAQYFEDVSSLVSDSAFVLVNRVVKQGQPVNPVEYQFKGKSTSL